MRNKEIQNSKIKRILMYWQYLTTLRIEPQASLDFVSYIFSIKEQWIIKIIRTRSLEEEELKAIDLDSIDLELDMIEAYHKKLMKTGRKDRPRQKKLF